MKRINRNFSALSADEIHETLMFHVKHLYMMTEEEYQSLLRNDNVVCAMVFLDFWCQNHAIEDMCQKVMSICFSVITMLLLISMNQEIILNGLFM